MSQPTRARTTGGATPRKKDRISQPPLAPETGATSPSLAPETVARTLRAVAAELERDPDLARRVAQALAESDASQPAVATSPDASEEPVSPPAAKKRGVNQSFRPRLVTGTSPDLGSGIPDPFALARRRGEAGLRAALDELRLGTLRAIVREHKLDPGGKLSRLNDTEKLREAILAAVRA